MDYTRFKPTRHKVMRNKLKAFTFQQGLWILITLVVCGCHANDQVQTPSSGPEPRNMMSEFGQIWLDNGTNCSKIGTGMIRFIDDNAEAWRNYLIAETIERVKDGQSPSKAIEDLLSLPKSTEDKIEHSICQDNSVVEKAIEKFNDEIIDKVEAAAQNYINANTGNSSMSP